jgi:hypothetical protein
MPAFINSVRNILPGFGSPAYNGQLLGQALTAAGPTTLTIGSTTTTPAGGTPFNLDGSAGPRAGYWRLRSSAVNGATTFAATITASDGTNTWVIGAVGVTAAGALVDRIGEFNVDEPQSATLTGLTSISAAITLGGGTTTATVDFEVSMTN